MMRHDPAILGLLITFMLVISGCGSPWLEKAEIAYSKQGFVESVQYQGTDKDSFEYDVTGDRVQRSEKKSHQFFEMVDEVHEKNIDQNSADIVFKIYSGDKSGFGLVQIEWWQNENEISKSLQKFVRFSKSPQVKKFSISRLEPNTSYKYKIYIQNLSGSFSTPIKSFSTYKENNRTPVVMGELIEVEARVPTKIDVLTNDIDPDGDPLFLNNVQSTGGALAIVRNNKILYSNKAEGLGFDQPKYTVTDKQGGMVEGSVDITRRFKISLANEILKQSKSPFAIQRDLNSSSQNPAVSIDPNLKAQVYWEKVTRNWGCVWRAGFRCRRSGWVRSSAVWGKQFGPEVFDGSAFSVKEPDLNSRHKTNPNIAIDVGGNAIVVWSPKGGRYESQLKARKISASNLIGPDVTISKMPYDFNPEICSGKDTLFIIIWRRDSDKIFARGVEGSLGSGSGERLVRMSSGRVQSPKVLCDSNGNSLMLWSESSCINCKPKIWFRPYDHKLAPQSSSQFLFGPADNNLNFDSCLIDKKKEGKRYLLTALKTSNVVSLTKFEWNNNTLKMIGEESVTNLASGPNVSISCNDKGNFFVAWSETKSVFVRGFDFDLHPITVMKLVHKNSRNGEQIGRLDLTSKHNILFIAWENKSNADWRNNLFGQFLVLEDLTSAKSLAAM